uniref:U39-Eretoxin-Ek1d_1 n=1 Tax=Eresus cinnaberinus TaxID=175337 RepID=A0A2D0PC30_ERECI
MLAYFVLAICVCLSTSDAEDKEVTIPKDKEQCLTQMIQWCNNMKYPQDGAGMTMLAITFQDPSGYHRVFCVSDSDGTNCTQNGSPWFACSPDNQFSYKGNMFTEGSKDVDDDICSTADRAFNDLFVQNLTFDNTTLKTENPKRN